MGAPEESAPVYDERGNVRPRGTAGARPMSYEERVEVARRIGSFEGPARVEPVERKSTPRSRR